MPNPFPRARRRDYHILLCVVSLAATTLLLVYGPVKGDSPVAGFLFSIGGLFVGALKTAFDDEFRSPQEMK